jgi:magnesium chelatase family protein
MGPAQVREYCQVNAAGPSLLRAAMKQLQMSAHAYYRTRSVKLARTIADSLPPRTGLAGSDQLETVHLAEAIQYRPRRQG